MIPFLVAHASDDAPVVEAPAVEAPPAPAPVRETREVYDAGGRLLRRLALEGDRLVEEVTFAYDDAGRVVAEVHAGGGSTTAIARTYGADGQLAAAVTTVDGVETAREEWTWSGERPATRRVVAGGRALVTTWTWDAFGTATSVETRDAAGALVERVVADRPAPAPTPFRPAGITVGFDAGLGSNSDVDTSDLKLGFNLARKPEAGTYDKDPLEVRFGVIYQVAKSKGELVNQYSDLKFGLDYNHLVPGLTVFLFGDVERNPVANLQIDVEAAPVGAKLTVVERSKGPLLDVSAAPIWNYRALALPDGGDCEGLALPPGASCDFSRAQASVRLRVGYEAGAFKVRDTVEFLPTLTPKSGTVIDALDDESVFRNTFTLEAKLGKHVTFKENLVFTRDPLLALQADCAAEPDSLLCDGMSLKTGTTLGLAWTFTPPVH